MEKVEKVFLVGSRLYSFCAGEPCEVTGVAFVTPEGLEPRSCYCYKIRTPGSEEDFVPISDSDNYKLISEADVAEGNIPSVVN